MECVCRLLLFIVCILKYCVCLPDVNNNTRTVRLHGDLTLVLRDEPVKGNVTCDLNTEFACTNGLLCVPIIKYNNSVNDCGDNSDEVSSPCRSPQFTCLNGGCTMVDFVLDGQDDCKDGSDEVKIIGSACDMIDKCCYCQDYVKYSECRDASGSLLCQCMSGYYPDGIGVTCIKRKSGDSCTSDPDCYNAFSNSSCVGGFCTCDVGYHVSDQNTTCVRNLVHDSCTSDEQCTIVIPNSNCTQSTCMCDSGYYESPDRTTCIRRILGDNCNHRHDCITMDNSNCYNESCTCNYGYVTSDKNSSCMIRRIGDYCYDNNQCDMFTDNSQCENNLCICNLGHFSLAGNTFCKRRRLKDICHFHKDCSYAVKRSSCINGLCECTWGYDNSADRTICVGNDDTLNVVIISSSVFTISVLIFINVVLIGFLVIKFVL